MRGTTINGSRNDPLRGSKRTTLEGGIRVPFVVSWKGTLPEGVVYDQPVIQLDVLPTVLAAAGVKVEPEWKLDGVNLLPYVKGEISGVAARRALLAAGPADGHSSRRLEARALRPDRRRSEAKSDEARAAQTEREGDAGAALQPGSRPGREGGPGHGSSGEGRGATGPVEFVGRPTERAAVGPGRQVAAASKSSTRPFARMSFSARLGRA